MSPPNSFFPIVCFLILFQFLKRPTTFFWFCSGSVKHISPSLEAQTRRDMHICKPDSPPRSLSPPSHHHPAANRCPLPDDPLSPQTPLSGSTHHDRDMKNVHLLLHDLRRLLEAGGGGPGEMLGAAHGDVEVQGAVLQPLLLPVHQRDVSHSPRHLCRDTTRNRGSVFFSMMLKGNILKVLEIRTLEPDPLYCLWRSLSIRFFLAFACHFPKV